jgi:hypothetical protein
MHLESPRSWNHGYTFVGGAIAGLALSYRPWLIFAGGVTVGVLLVYALRLVRRLAAAGELGIGWLRRKAEGQPDRHTAADA